MKLIKESIDLNELKSINESYLGDSIDAIPNEYMEAWEKMKKAHFLREEDITNVELAKDVDGEYIYIEFENGEAANLFKDGNFWHSEMDYKEEENFENTIGATSTKDAKKWLNSQLEEYGNTYFFPPDIKKELNRLISDFGNTYFWDKVDESLKEDYEDSPYYNITYKVADGIFSTLIVKANNEEEAKEIFDERKPNYADAVIGNRKISTEEAEGLLKRGMSLLEDLDGEEFKDTDDFYVGWARTNKSELLNYLKDNNLHVYNQGDRYTLGTSKDDTYSQVITKDVGDQLKLDKKLNKYFVESISEEFLKEDFQSFKSTLGQDSHGLEDWKNIIYSVLKKAGLAEGANVVFNKNSIDFTFDPKLFKNMDDEAANKLISNTIINEMDDAFLKNGWKLGYQPSAALAAKDKGKYEIEVQFVRPFTESINLSEEKLKKDFKSKADALAYLKKKSEEDPEAAALIQAFLQLMKEPKEESLVEGKDSKLGSVEDYLSQMIKAINKQAVEKIVAKAAGNPNADEAYKRWLKLHPEKEESLNEDIDEEDLKNHLAKSAVSDYYQGKIDLPTLHNRLKVVFGDLKTAVEWLADYDKEPLNTKKYVNEDTQIDKIEVEVKLPKEDEGKSVEETEEIADTPNPPEVGIDTYVANTLGDLIVGEWDTIKEYNNFMNELIVNKASVDILNVIKDIVAEEHEHIGQLQQALKTVAPNAINLAAGEEEGSKQIAAPVDVGDPSVDGDEPTEKEIKDDTLLSPEEAEEKEDE